MRTVTVTDNESGKSVQCPVREPTMGNPAFELAPVHKELGLFTYDPGLVATCPGESNITFIDGEKGELYYRGYPIEELAEKKNHLDICYLLLSRKLPDRMEYEEFDMLIRKRYFLHEKLMKLFGAFPDNAHPMAALSSAVAALSSFYHNYMEEHGQPACSIEDFYIMAQRVIAKIPVIAALAYRHNLGKPQIYPDIKRYFTENFLYMMRAYPYGEVDIDPVEVEALDKIFLLHADHEQNASTTAVRVVGSTNAHPYAAISAGIAALWGPAHGGANEAVLRQLEMIGSIKNVDKYIKKAKDKDDPFRLMGFGHRVYKNYDPRAKILKGMLDQLKNRINIDGELMEIALKIEEIALTDEYFIKRKLYPNVDFYSGIILTALKIPKEMFTPIFVIGRSVGWVSQWFELRCGGDNKIYRPRQIYLGDTDKHL